MFPVSNCESNKVWAKNTSSLKATANILETEDVCYLSAFRVALHRNYTIHKYSLPWELRALCTLCCLGGADQINLINWSSASASAVIKACTSLRSDIKKTRRGKVLPSNFKSIAVEWETLLMRRKPSIWLLIFLWTKIPVSSGQCAKKWKTNKQRATSQTLHASGRILQVKDPNNTIRKRMKRCGLYEITW